MHSSENIPANTGIRSKLVPTLAYTPTKRRKIDENNDFYLKR